jgi:SAM-dependent methyltransferase
MLEAPDRRRTLDPETFWDRVGLAEGARVADVGAGTGFFTAPASDRVGGSGHVFAVDISEELVEWPQARMRREARENVTVVLASPGAIPLPDASVDVVLLANVLHDLTYASVAEAVRLLAPGGQLLNLDWSKRPDTPGPPLAIRLASPDARRLIESLGLTFEEEFAPGPGHYAQRFRRPRPVRSGGRASRGRTRGADVPAASGLNPPPVLVDPGDGRWARARAGDQKVPMGRGRTRPAVSSASGSGSLRA